MNTAGGRDDPSTPWAWFLLAGIVSGGLILRMPALHWLASAAVSPDYSFEPDANRFLFAARNITAYQSGLVSDYE